MVGIGHEINLGSRADHKALGWFFALVPKRVPNWDAGLEGRRITWAQKRFTVTFNQRDFTFEHIDEFILVAVPVLDGGASVRLQYMDERTELGKAPRLSQPALQIRLLALEVGNRLDELIGRFDDRHGSPDRKAAWVLRRPASALSERAAEAGRLGPRGTG